METRDVILQRIKAHLPFGGDPHVLIREDSILTELGFDSLHLITMLLDLQREYSFDTACMTENGMPATVGDLVRLAEHGRAVNMRKGAA